MKKLSCLRK